MSRAKVRQVPPDAATRRRIKDDLRCWSCAAEARLTFTPRKGLTASTEHLADCRAVSAENRAAGRLVHQVSPVLYETGHRDG